MNRDISTVLASLRGNHGVWVSLVAQTVNNPPAMQGSTPGSGRSEEGNGWLGTPVLLPRRIPWTAEPGRLQSVGSQRVGHD